MKSVCYMRPGLEIVDFPEPNIENPCDIKIKMAYASICGSDGHALEGAYDQFFAGENQPHPLGHESSGVIVEMGAGCSVKGLKVGDRVIFYFQQYCGKCYYCRNGKEAMCTGIITTASGMSEYIVVDEQQVYKIPEDVGLREACLTEPVSVALHGVERAEIKLGNSVAVFGAGAIGLLTIQLARLSGACPLVCYEPVASKREIALKMGADYALDPTAIDFMDKIFEITNSRGYDVVIECAGIAPAAEPAFKAVAPAGTLVYTSTHAPSFNMPLNLYTVWLKEMTIRGVFQSPYSIGRAVSILARMNLKDVITAEYYIDQAKEAFAEQKTGKHPKIVLRF